MLFDDEDSELVSGYECSKNSDFMCFFLDDNFNFNRLIKYFMKWGDLNGNNDSY